MLSDEEYERIIDTALEKGIRKIAINNLPGDVLNWLVLFNGAERKTREEYDGNGIYIDELVELAGLEIERRQNESLK